ncbi:hypothetical protein [Vibrio penaeicida]|uniref:Uncharacterized protein n=1 Tax=Vibrio penaeicida TaxID=104609 RepID=A0AAV5NKH9_9VIBR|nr:hypothetical protein [Vibrio penaeicida]RTZ24608.1 hypothetical protein EKN09_02820 [Vibrio penaeicida]GLQ71109.1 hypothetical protein GCM10007932_04690 [Vibrio penaeicida]
MSFVNDLLAMARAGGINQRQFKTEGELVVEWHTKFYRYQVRNLVNPHTSLSKKLEIIDWLLDDNDDPSIPFTIASYAYCKRIPSEQLTENIQDLLRCTGILRMLEHTKQTPAVVKTARKIGSVLKHDQKSIDRYTKVLSKELNIDPKKARNKVLSSIRKEKKAASHGQLDFFEKERSRMGLKGQLHPVSKGGTL